MVTLSINGISASFSLADVDSARILAAYGAILSAADEGETVVGIAKGVVAGLAQTAIRYEQEVAAKAAADAVPSIDATLLPAGA
jgi:hypothetical protein